MSSSCAWCYHVTYNCYWCAVAGSGLKGGEWGYLLTRHYSQTGRRETVCLPVDSELLLTCAERARSFLFQRTGLRNLRPWPMLSCFLRNIRHGYRLLTYLWILRWLGRGICCVTGFQAAVWTGTWAQFHMNPAVLANVWASLFQFHRGFATVTINQSWWSLPWWFIGKKSKT